MSLLIKVAGVVKWENYAAKKQRLLDSQHTNWLYRWGRGTSRERIQLYKDNVGKSVQINVLTRIDKTNTYSFVLEGHQVKYMYLGVV